MGIESLFNATCDVKRRQTQGTKDDLGFDDGEFTYAAHLSGQACRYEGRAFMPQKDMDDVVTVDGRLFFPAGTDIKSTDRVENVTLTEDGSVLVAKADVESVDAAPGGMKHHVEALVQSLA